MAITVWGVTAAAPAGAASPGAGPGGTITAAPARAVARPFPACQARLVDDAPGLGGAGGPVRLVCS